MFNFILIFIEKKDEIFSLLHIKLIRVLITKILSDIIIVNTILILASLQHFFFFYYVMKQFFADI